MDDFRENSVAGGYTTKVRFRHILLIALTLLVTACNKAPQNKDAIKQAVVEHLNKGSGLDMSLMDVEVGSVTYNDNQAKATVTFRPKSSPDQAMSMSYTLEAKGNKWSVVKKEGGGGAPAHGEGQAMPPAGGMAPSMPPPGGGQALPPGHPPVPDGQKKAESPK